MAYKKELYFFETREGRAPFLDWLAGLKDIKARAIVRTRLDRLEYGHASDSRMLGQGVCELRIHFGPGYRIYYGEDGNSVIILLCGGDKGSQARDIHRAKLYWQIYRTNR